MINSSEILRTSEPESVLKSVELLPSADSADIEPGSSKEERDGCDISEVSEISSAREDIVDIFNQQTTMTPAGDLSKPAHQDSSLTTTEIKRNAHGSPRIRKVRMSDLDQLVKVDMEAFSKVYASYGMEDDELRSDLRRKFKMRLERVEDDWTQVLEDRYSGDIIGFMMCCPTSKTPDEFKSWEDTTDDGTLSTTYDPAGENIYIVSLTVKPGTMADKAQDMMYTNLIGKFIAEGYERAFFESRLPGLRMWLRRQCKKNDQTLDGLSDEQLDVYANEYANLTKVNSKGKVVKRDILLRSFEEFGIKFTRVVPNAYKDEPSLNYGAVGVFENPIPKIIRKVPGAEKVVGNTLRLASRSQKLLKKVI